MSHQYGATLSTLSDQTIPLIARMKLSAATQRPMEQAPMFQDWNIRLDIEHSTSMHAAKFTMGTRGNVESMPLEVSGGTGRLYGEEVFI